MTIGRPDLRRRIAQERALTLRFQTYWQHYKKALLGLATLAGLAGIGPLIATVYADAWAQRLLAGVAAALLVLPIAIIIVLAMLQLVQAGLETRRRAHKCDAWERCLFQLLIVNRVLRQRTSVPALVKCIETPRGIPDFLTQSVQEMLRYLSKALEQLTEGRTVTSQFVRIDEKSQTLEETSLRTLVDYPDLFSSRMRLEEDYLAKKSGTIYHYVFQTGMPFEFRSLADLAAHVEIETWSGMSEHVQSGDIALVRVNGKAIGCVVADSPDVDAFPDLTHLAVRYTAHAIGCIHQETELLLRVSTKLRELTVSRREHSTRAELLEKSRSEEQRKVQVATRQLATLERELQEVKSERAQLSSNAAERARTIVEKDARTRELDREVSELRSRVRSETSRSHRLQEQLARKEAELARKDAVNNELLERIESLLPRVSSLSSHEERIGGRSAEDSTDGDQPTEPNRAPR